MAFFKIFSWLFVLFNGLLFSCTDKEASASYWVCGGIFFLIMIAFSNIPLIPSIRSKDVSLKAVLASNIQFFCFLCFICITYIDWGYGRTVGILGYNKPLGFFSVFNAPRTLIFVLLCASCTALIIAQYCRFSSVCDTHCLQFVKPKLIKGILLAVTAIAITAECVYYFVNEELLKVTNMIIIVQMLCIVAAEVCGLLKRTDEVSSD